MVIHSGIRGGRDWAKMLQEANATSAAKKARPRRAYKKDSNLAGVASLFNGKRKYVRSGKHSKAAKAAREKRPRGRPRKWWYPSASAYPSQM